MRAISITRTETLDATPERVWQILAEEFTEVSRWASGVESSGPNPEVVAPDGAPIGGRVCEVPGFGFTDERFTHYDPAAGRFGFTVDAEKIPGFVKGMRADWTVADAGKGSARVSSRLTADVSGVIGAVMTPIMRRRFAALTAEVFADLRVYAETGSVSDSKRRALAKAGR